MAKKTFLILFVLIHLTSHAQRAKQDAQLLAYNIGFNGITAGIGAIINKDKEHTWYQSFVKGFYQGCIGGAIIYSGKKMIYLVNNEKAYPYAWPSKIIYYTGASIVESASLNRAFGKYWNIDVLGFRCDLSFDKEKYLKIRLSASSIYSVAVLLPKNRFDLRRTISTGTLIFSNDTTFEGNNGCAAPKANFIRTNINFSSTYHEYYIAAHELTHNYQYREYEIFNTWLKPFERYCPEKARGFFSKYLYLDMPYFGGFYAIEGKHDYYHYFNNFYELEAQYFATKKYIKNYSVK